MIGTPFDFDQYTLKKQFLKLFGGTFRIYTPAGDLAIFASMKAFRLKEDIRLYTDEQKTNEVLVIKARSALDWSAAYDVMEKEGGEKLGALQRRGFKSMLRDEWVILDQVGNEVGKIVEDSMLLALLRRFATNLIPQKLHGEMRGQPVFRFNQHFNPFVVRMTLDFTPDTGKLLDRRLGLAAAVLLAAIEGRQE